jgi:hypothetical protein
MLTFYEYYYENNTRLTPPELEVLNIVWSLGQATVRDVKDGHPKGNHDANRQENLLRRSTNIVI